MTESAAADLRKEIEDLRGRIAAMEERERSWMRAGLFTLGGVVVTLIGYIWAQAVGRP